MNIEYRIVRSKRKTVGIEIGPDAAVTVRAPERVSLREIERILTEKEAWILKNRRRILNRLEEEAGRPPEETEKLTAEEVRQLKRKAMVVIPERVRYYAPILHVSYGRISIRTQHSRWGSCSSKGNLNFNCLLMLMPPEVVDYIVVHELAHRLEMNHSPRFYGIVAGILPNYREMEKYLKNEGAALMRRL
ncbi:MAG: M48 family metallopeptidase [Lachnospiraceae bacterium]|nr:M48 family metallopeptidase [Lachnospiraceae bacterium]